MLQTRYNGLQHSLAFITQTAAVGKPCNKGL